MRLDPQKKFQLVDDIINYLRANDFTYRNNGVLRYRKKKVEILLERFGIFYSGEFHSDDLLDADDEKIGDLAKYLLNDEGLNNLFHDKYAIEILATEERFSNLNLYLHECFECIKADRKIATAILLRACVEIFIDVGGFKKAYTLGSNIEALIPLMEKDESFEMFNKNNKQSELKQFLKGIKDFGDDAAHLNGKNVKDFIEKFENKELLKLFCILIEHSILKDGIRERNETDVENMIKSIDFIPKEKFLEQEEISDISSSADDEIPF